MIKVYFETENGSYAQQVAWFDDEETYNACSEALEALAEKNGYIVTESVEYDEENGKINYCNTVITDEQILANEMRLVGFLGLDQYHVLLESGEVKTDLDKIECIRDGIEYYCDAHSPNGTKMFLNEFKDVINP